MHFNLLALNLNLTSKENLKLKKNYKIKYMDKKIIFNNINIKNSIVYINKNINIIHPKLIPIIYIYSTKKISILKFKQYKNNKFNFNTQLIKFF